MIQTIFAFIYNFSLSGTITMRWPKNRWKLKEIHLSYNKLCLLPCVHLCLHNVFIYFHPISFFPTLFEWEEKSICSLYANLLKSNKEIPYSLLVKLYSGFFPIHDINIKCIENCSPQLASRLSQNLDSFSYSSPMAVILNCGSKGELL